MSVFENFEMVDNQINGLNGITLEYLMKLVS